MRPQGSAEELEGRRRRAVALIDQGEDKHAVARILGVGIRSVDRWLQHRRERGAKGLAAKPHPPRPSRLTAARQRQVLRWLVRNPTEFGFATELWTARRVVQLIERRWHVHYHPHYMSRWLSAHGISPQKPRRQALERNEQVVEAWIRKIWPGIKKGPGASMRGSW